MTTSTASAPSPIILTHEHGWIVASRHATSEGCVLYVRCDECGIHRVDIELSMNVPPAALSRTTTPAEFPPAVQRR